MREEIVTQAVAAFNRKGISNTSLRDIAQELSISDGHLRYYFKTKEELVLTIFSGMAEEIASQATQLYDTQGAAPVLTAQLLVQALTKTYGVMYRYVFLFTESTAILETFPRVYAAYQQLFQNRRDMFLALFEQFKRKGDFAGDVDANLFPLLFEQVFILSDNWVKYARLPKNNSLSEAAQIQHYVAVTIALFLPYLNARLKTEVADWLREVAQGLSSKL
ncbi:TetR/AcrR family transcriptional regulator [Rufibacter glacialis]|uniref:TetR/AcrR family transcriptional regulator n=1 Tax=Rufibacter glacialis TaxID=1259555 RepID=A0A5M8QHL1_9BACT|nr:TetR/AcrR family transcriptional regulator [Rufibacter glacialis]KAA6435577.1 TetR/AcrR family transcriptional regulator [Rufibacter glacialis]GGK64707.1 hypothetical protein GCM10011405_10880 [Rufibacter glacialis]